jgi:hypothetical protein
MLEISEIYHNKYLITECFDCINKSNLKKYLINIEMNRIIDILNNVSKYNCLNLFLKRSKKVNSDYPILTFKNDKNYTYIYNGLHRYMKAYLDKEKKIKAYILDDNYINNIDKFINICNKNRNEENFKCMLLDSQKEYMIFKENFMNLIL